jgi:hypothetical protein
MKREWMAVLPAFLLVACGGPESDTTLGTEQTRLSALDDSGTEAGDRAKDRTESSAAPSEGLQSVEQSSRSITPMATHSCPPFCQPMVKGCTGFLLWASCYCPKGNQLCADGGDWIDGACFGAWWKPCIP